MGTATHAAMIKALKAAEEGLDSYVTERTEGIAHRKSVKLDAKQGDTSAQGMLADEAQGMLDVLRALGRLDTSRKNAEAALTKLAAQAKKDLELASVGATEAATAQAKARNLCKELAGSLQPVIQKSHFPVMELETVFNQLDMDKNIDRGARAKLVQSCRNARESIGESLKLVAQTLTAVSRDLESFGRD